MGRGRLRSGFLSVNIGSPYEYRWQRGILPWTAGELKGSRKTCALLLPSAMVKSTPPYAGQVTNNPFERIRLISSPGFLSVIPPGTGSGPSHGFFDNLCAGVGSATLLGQLPEEKKPSRRLGDRRAARHPVDTL